MEYHHHHGIPPPPWSPPPWYPPPHQATDIFLDDVMGLSQIPLSWCDGGTRFLESYHEIYFYHINHSIHSWWGGSHYILQVVVTIHHPDIFLDDVMGLSQIPLPWCDGGTRFLESYHEIYFYHINHSIHSWWGGSHYILQVVVTIHHLTIFFCLGLIYSIVW